MGIRGKLEAECDVGWRCMASMGPRMGIRGKRTRRAYCSSSRARASMGPRMGIRGKALPHLAVNPAVASFNGAADGDPRKAAHIRRGDDIRRRLQWGRGWGSAESRDQGPRREAAPGLQWGRGWGSAESSTPSLHVACLDALQWGRGWGSAESARSTPKPVGHPLRLQWGRGWGSAESPGHVNICIRDLSFNGAADGDPRKDGG